jgi:hypothetical protein
MTLKFIFNQTPHKLENVSYNDDKEKKSVIQKKKTLYNYVYFL